MGSLAKVSFDMRKLDLLGDWEVILQEKLLFGRLLAVFLIKYIFFVRSRLHNGDLLCCLLLSLEFGQSLTPFLLGCHEGEGLRGVEPVLLHCLLTGFTS